MQKLDFYSPNKEKILKVELDYGKVSDELKKMNYDNKVEILNEGRIVLSNKKHGTESENYEKVKKRSKYTYCQEVNLYGTELEIRIDESEKTGWDSLMNKFPIILLLIFVNVILPVLFVYLINRSFTKRITKLSKVFQSVNNEQLIYMSDERGKDEIGSMIRNYNRMVERTNGHMTFCINLIILKFGSIGCDLLVWNMCIKTSTDSIRRNSSNFAFVRTVFPAFSSIRCYL